jgi:hypothetical protein
VSRKEPKYDLLDSDSSRSDDTTPRNKVLPDLKEEDWAILNDALESGGLTPFQEQWLPKIQHRPHLFQGRATTMLGIKTRLYSFGNGKHKLIRFGHVNPMIDIIIILINCED